MTVAMGTSYCQLALSERIEIYRLRCAGWSCRQIAAVLGRAPSTISRELLRNSKRTKVWRGGYEPARADHLAQRRRQWDCRFKLARQPALRNLVRDRLAMGWSPEQTSGRLALNEAPMRVSHESIYRYIYHLVAQKVYWNRLLPMRKGRRGRLKRGGLSPLKALKQRVPVHERPSAAADRRQAGHWEADLMQFSRYGPVVLVAHERTSRFVQAWLRPDKQARPMAACLMRRFKALPDALRRTITFDNGTEFAAHHRLNRTLNMQTYFCDAHSPWQKGGVENAISRLRRRLPRKTDLAKLGTAGLDAAIRAYNTTPRKCLDFKTPAEAFEQHLKALHFKRESIHPPARA